MLIIDGQKRSIIRIGEGETTRSPTRISDATATFGKVDFTGKHHETDEVDVMSLSNLQGEHATILSTEEILIQARE